MSIASPISFAYPLQSYNKNHDSISQCLQLNAFITGNESHKQFAIGLTVEQIPSAMAAGTNEMWNQQKQSLKNNKTSTVLWKGRSQKKSSQSDINFEAQS